MKIGVSTFAWTGRFEQRHLELFSLLQARRLAGDAMVISVLEVPMFVPRDLPVAAIRQAVQSTGIGCTVCAILPPGINPISPSPEERALARRHFEECIRTAAEMGASLIAGPVLAPIGYLPGHRPTTEEWSWAVEYLHALATALVTYGLTLAIEPVNRAETFLLRTLADAKALCEEVGSPNIGITVDTFHANIEEKDMCSAVATLGPWLRHVHASESDRGLLGTGHVPVKQLLKTLKQIRYDGLLMLEGFGYLEAESSAPGYLWADQAVTPQSIAFDGERFLRDTLLSVSS